MSLFYQKILTPCSINIQKHFAARTPQEHLHYRHFLCLKPVMSFICISLFYRISICELPKMSLTVTPDQWPGTMKMPGGYCGRLRSDSMFPEYWSAAQNMENIDIVGGKIKLKSLEGCILIVQIKYPQKDSVREFGGMDRHKDSGIFEPIRRMANASFIEDWCKQAFSGPPKDHDSL